MGGSVRESCGDEAIVRPGETAEEIGEGVRGWGGKREDGGILPVLGEIGDGEVDGLWPAHVKSSHISHLISYLSFWQKQ